MSKRDELVMAYMKAVVHVQGQYDLDFLTPDELVHAFNVVPQTGINFESFLRRLKIDPKELEEADPETGLTESQLAENDAGLENLRSLSKIAPNVVKIGKPKKRKRGSDEKDRLASAG